MAGSAVHEAPCVIGPRITVRGSLVGEEDVVVQGRVEGSIALTAHLLIAGPALVAADIEADSVEIHGQVEGDVVAAEGITLREGARVVGNLRAPRVEIADGAQFKGAVEMDVPLPGNVLRQPRAR
ncbi:polymer-forming cytoskeletal protein [Nannocystis pusilla]|jgi:cytoskeletal protein CcmA (bactofilin family)|uniref:Polymer-forming cytoskeletal protein n=1 Tax=Nannocystis pusilla TaxID=889268 RepID=A0A9X3J0V4_9BACT|nr:MULTISPECIES: polymer-forming cytoskeletal protein [Nannocystis]MCY1012117.1 polymer-forming cytoskeletal protein [Nannocystis pusilla]MCY1066852.1 polymer-forming cytoskeletal protein [Nannocystis sp. RBIL2]